MGSGRRSAGATNRSATTAGRHPGSRDVDAFADDGPFRRAECAARCAPGLGHCERTHQAHSRFRHQRTDGPGGIDKGRQRRQDDAINPRLRKWDGTWTTLVITSVGTDARTRAALRTTLQDKRFGELREGIWLRPDNVDVELTIEVLDRVRLLHSKDDDPAGLAARLWDLPAWVRTARELLDEITTTADIPG